MFGIDIDHEQMRLPIRRMIGDDSIFGNADPDVIKQRVPNISRIGAGRQLETKLGLHDITGTATRHGVQVAVREIVIVRPLQTFEPLLVGTVRPFAGVRRCAWSGPGRWPAAAGDAARAESAAMTSVARIITARLSAARSTEWCRRAERGRAVRRAQNRGRFSPAGPRPIRRSARHTNGLPDAVHLPVRS